MKIEICANSFESALAAQKAGADRIELCSSLGLGGLTPSYGTIKKTVSNLDIPVHILIRPRSGNFTYTKDEVEVMLEDITCCKELGCQGIVSGALTSKNQIDKKITRRLQEAAFGMTFTFHRAFDRCIDAYDAFKSLKAMQVHRILSSGQETTALRGIELLKELKNLSQGSIEIMPGSGINASNIAIFKNAGFDSVHFSATEPVWFSNEKPKISMHSTKHLDEQSIYTSSSAKIEEIVQLLR